MRFVREKSSNYLRDDTSIPNLFIEAYMPEVPGDFLKVYVYALMCSGTNQALNNELIAERLSISSEEVNAAWDWLAKKKIIKKHYPDALLPQRFDVIFVDLKAEVFDAGEGYSDRREGDAESMRDTSLDDPAVQALFREIEQAIGRPISGGDYQRIGALLNEWEASPEIIVEAYRYRVAKGWSLAASNVGETVKEWVERGFETAEDVNAWLAQSDIRESQYRQIMKSLGLGRPKATDAEKKQFDYWLDELGMSLNDVLNVAAKAAGKNDMFSYVKKVIESERDKRAGRSAPGGASSSGGRTSGNSGRGYGRSGGVAGHAGGKPSRKQILEMRRKSSEDAAAGRQKEIYEKCPRIRVLDAEITRLNMESVSLLVSGASGRRSAVDAINRALEEKQAERAGIMTESGFPEDYTEIRYHCPLCKDTGILDDGTQCRC